MKIPWKRIQECPGANVLLSDFVPLVRPKAQPIVLSWSSPHEVKFRGHFWLAFDFDRWHFKTLLEWFAKHLLQKSAKHFHLQNGLQPKFRLEFGGNKSCQWLQEAKKVSFFVTQTKETSFGQNSKVPMQSVRSHEEILCGLTNGRASLCILLGPHRYSLAPCNHLLHQRATKKVSSPNLKCSVFCSKHTKKVVSYLTSILIIWCRIFVYYHI